MTENHLNDFYSLISFPGSYPVPEKKQFIDCHLQKNSASSIRFNPYKSSVSDKAFFDVHSVVQYNQNGVHLKNRPSFIKDPFWHSGLYYVQEASSMYIGSVIAEIIQKQNNTSKIRILDLCASPGGKTTDISSCLRPRDLLVSNEIHPQRAEILYENSVKWGVDNIWVTNNQASDFSHLQDYFDIIVIDAPCSGSGMWRKDKETINEWSPKNVAACAERQKSILNDIIPALKDDGIIIYSTCSYSEEENEDILDYIAAHYSIKDFPIDNIDKKSTIRTQSKSHNISGYRCAPWHSDGEGFFFSAIQLSKNSSNKLKYKNKIKSIPSISGIHPIENRIFFQSEKNVFNFIHQDHEEDLYIFSQQKKIKFRKTGTAVGEMIKHQLIPDHEWAMSIHNIKNEYSSVSLNLEQALDYLRKENIHLEADMRGWALVTYKDHSLGWIKALNNRTNNYYPKNWRIRFI